MPTKSKATKNQLGCSTADYTAFTFNPENLRKNIDRPDLLEKLRSDERILTPFIVYPESYNIDGKMVVFEGNCRLWQLMLLANDPTYTGSIYKDIPYVFLPEDIAGDKRKERLYQISLGTTNESYDTLTQAETYQQLINEEVEDKVKSDPEFDKLSEQQKKVKIKKLVRQAKIKLSEEVNIQTRYMDILLTVLDTTKENKPVKDAILEGLIAPRSVDTLQSLATKHKLPVNTVLNLAKKAMIAESKATISAKVLESVAKLLEQPTEVIDLVNSGAVPIGLAEKVSLAANRAETTPTNLISEALDSFAEPNGQINEESIEKAVKSFVASPQEFLSGVELDDVVEETEAKHKELEPTKEELTEAKQRIESFAIWLANQANQNFKNFEPLDIIATAKTLYKLEHRLETKWMK